METGPAKFFREIYANADDKTRMAMNKSYVRLVFLFFLSHCQFLGYTHTHTQTFRSVNTLTTAL